MKGAPIGAPFNEWQTLNQRLLASAVASALTTIFNHKCLRLAAVARNSTATITSISGLLTISNAIDSPCVPRAQTHSTSRITRSRLARSTSSDWSHSHRRRGCYCGDCGGILKNAHSSFSSSITSDGGGGKGGKGKNGKNCLHHTSSPKGKTPKHSANYLIIVAVQKK